MKSEQFIKQMGKEWVEKFKPFIESPECDKIYKQLQGDSKKEKIYPESKDTFKAFRLTSLKDVNLIIIGDMPDHGLNENKKPLADGLLLSNSYGDITPAIKEFFSHIAWEEDLPEELYFTNDLSFLASQGVLLVNKSFTSPEDHAELWEPLWKFYFKYIHDYSIPVLSLGIEADRISFFRKKDDNYYNIQHPKFCVDSDEIMTKEKIFTQINDYLEESKDIRIKWCIDSWNKYPQIDNLDSNLLPF